MLVTQCVYVCCADSDYDVRAKIAEICLPVAIQVHSTGCGCVGCTALVAGALAAVHNLGVSWLVPQVKSNQPAVEGLLAELLELSQDEMGSVRQVTLT